MKIKFTNNIIYVILNVYYCFQVPFDELSIDRLHHRAKSCLYTVVNRNTIFNSGCELCPVSYGETDNAIVKRLLNDPEAFCVMSSDSDMSIFKGGRSIHLDRFDTTDELGLNQMALKAKIPKKLICGMVSSERLASFLKVFIQKFYS